jgi:hypothetical protein
MSAMPLNVQQMLMDQGVDMALTVTAQMFGLPKATVTTIVRASLPLMAQMAQSNPELLRRMQAAARVTMPEPIADFYARMARSQAVRQAAMDDYKATFGATFEAINRDAARQAGTTDGQARDVIAAVLPAVGPTLGQALQGSERQAFAPAPRSTGAE